MNSNVIAATRFIAALMTIVAILGQQHLPEKTRLLFPSDDAQVSLNGVNKDIFSHSIRWINPIEYSWRCKIHSREQLPSQGCGISLSWGQPPDIEIKTPTGSTPADVPYCTNTNSDEDNDGWGWERGQSCKVTDDSSSKPTSPKAPCLKDSSDVDGDGFGQEFGYPCEIREKLPTAKCSTTAQNLYHSNWGWEKGDFCLWPENQPFSLPESKVASAAINAYKGLTFDFSKYESLRVSVHYEGKASYLRVFLRNANPAYWHPEAANSSKFISASVLSEDLSTGPVNIPLRDFSVSEWWGLQHALPSELRGPEFEHVIALGVDLTQRGVHKVRLERIELVGKTLKSETLLFAVAVFWALYLMFESINQYQTFRRVSIERHREVNNLTRDQQKLERETSELQERSITDPLTGIFNRIGIAQFTDTLFKSRTAREALCLMIIDIDHFKSVNDSFGHDIGDKILKNVSHLLSTSIRQNDVFGRWGGEEFILICPKTDRFQAESLAEKLRMVIEQSQLEFELNLEVTISIGVTHVKKTEAFSEAFKRADVALYAAKNERNKVVYQG